MKNKRPNSICLFDGSLGKGKRLYLRTHNHCATASDCCYHEIMWQLSHIAFTFHFFEFYLFPLLSHGNLLSLWENNGNYGKLSNWHTDIQ